MAVVTTLRMTVMHSGKMPMTPRMTVMHSENARGMGFTSIILSCGKSWQTLRSREDCVLQGSLLLMQSLFSNQKTNFFLPFGLFVRCLLFCHWTASWGCTSVFLPLLLTNCESIKMVLLQCHGWFSAGKVQLVNCLKSNQDLFSYFCSLMFFFFLACILNPIVFFAHQIPTL
jgi:hypothetical protein